ncbi:MAG: hypothetical protein KatS3mg103_0998 [Phycisphaerales bacterium]|nr:MAG: hypothetical protein KatS3mg103_0998 [Phycisphaerales bacterium]
MDRICDALVLVFDEGATLVQLERSGALERHRGLWKALGARYEQMVLVSCDRQEQAAQAQELADTLGALCVCDPPGTYAHEHQDRAAATVADLLHGARRAVVQSVGLMASPTAVAVRSALAQAGIESALLVEGADLWSRQSICEFGPTSRAALEAAYREKLACTHADMVLAGCQPVADDLVWRFNLPAERVRVVPMPVLADACPVPASAREPGLILAFGPVTRRARLHLAVQAVAQLRRTDCPDARLQVLMDGPLAPALIEQAKELGVPLELVPSPTAQDAQQALDRCALLLYTATSETNPPAVFEALAVATPVVLAVDPLCAMEVVHGVSGLRMPAEPEALARGMAGLLMDAPWRDAMGNAGRERAYRDHSCQAVAQAMAQAQRDALDMARHHAQRPSPALVLAGQGLAALEPQEWALAWTQAIAEQLAQLRQAAPEHLRALQQAIAQLDPSAGDAPDGLASSACSRAWPAA